MRLVVEFISLCVSFEMRYSRIPEITSDQKVYFEFVYFIDSCRTGFRGFSFSIFVFDCENYREKVERIEILDSHRESTFHLKGPRSL